MPTTEELLARVDANLAETVRHIASTNDKLTIIASQQDLIAGSMIKLDETMAVLAEKVQVLGLYTNATIDHVQEHTEDPNAHDRGGQ